MTSPYLGPFGRSFPPPTRFGPSLRWDGTGNGALLRLAADNGFDALLTVDRGFAHQQSQENLPLPVVIMLAASNRPDELRPLVPNAIDVLSGPLQRRIYRVSDAAS